MLQADDILAGNFFLKDWHLTGVTFFTTDLIYFELVSLIFGVSYRAIYVANGLKFVSIAVTAYYAAMKGCCKDRNLKTVLFFLLAGVPCMSYMIHSKVHAGAVCLTFLAFCAVYDILQNSDINDRKMLWKYVLFAIVTALGTIGDMLAVVEGTIPVLLFSLYQLLMQDGWKRGSKYIKLAVSAIAGILAGLIWDRLYFFIGGANKNSYIGNQLFTDLFGCMEKVVLFTEQLLEMCMANFTGEKIADIWNLPKMASAASVIAAFVLIFIILRRMIQKEEKDTDELSNLLALSIIMSFLAFVLTDMAAPRYITLVPYAAVIIVVRNCSQMITYFRNKKLSVLILVTVAFVSFAGKIYDISGYQYPQSNIEDYQLIAFLKEHDLRCGYASFWNASKITVLSGKNVNVRHIIHSGETDDMLSIYRWFCKNEWYEESANFILINNEDGKAGEEDLFGVSEKRVIEFFGVPRESYEMDKYLILVYDYDISKKLNNLRVKSLQT
ncbi:MAG: hypothetical protein K2N87_17750 [Eubacterium sp.]|nr:hypothetical protein [Eubacterium sp.]